MTMLNQNFHKYIDHPVTKKVLASGPKRILALDGGGVRGALTIGFLERIESMLRSRYQNENFVLSDYFDLIGGTSTGAIIATMLAKGSTVSTIKSLYLKLGKVIFSKKLNALSVGILKYIFSAEYDVTILEKSLVEELKSTKLGSTSLRTGLVIFASRADTFSIYGFQNHPRNAYYEKNKNILLSDLLRASSAAPTYFKSKELEFGNGKNGIFIDGGVSGVNNPSLKLLLMATIKGYGYQWKTGKDNLLIISVGTGHHLSRTVKKQKAKLLTRSMAFWGPDIADLFMIDANAHNRMMLQYLSHSMLPEIVNREAGDLRDDLLTKEPLLEYCRYNALLDKGNLESLGKHYSKEKIKELRKMEKGENVDDLYEIGVLQAKKVVASEHFPEVFDYGIVDKHKDVLTQKEAQQAFIPILETLGNTYSKFQTIHAYIAKKEALVTSITTYGKETKNTAYPGDYVVTNQTKAKEKYVIRKEKFDERYTYIRDLAKGVAEYRAIGEVVGIEVTRDVLKRLKLPPHFEIIADWGSPQYIGKDDFIVCPLDKSEVYRIGREEFFETYTLGAEK